MSVADVLGQFPPTQAQELPPWPRRLDFASRPPTDAFSPIYALDWLGAHVPNFPAVRRQVHGVPSYVDMSYRQWAAQCRRAGRYVLDALHLTEHDAHTHTAPEADGEPMQLVVALCAHVDGVNYTAVSFVI